MRLRGHCAALLISWVELILIITNQVLFALVPIAENRISGHLEYGTRYGNCVLPIHHYPRKLYLPLCHETKRMHATLLSSQNPSLVAASNWRAMRTSLEGMLFFLQKMRAAYAPHVRKPFAALIASVACGCMRESPK